MAMQEALNMSLLGYKVHYLALGDLKMKDFKRNEAQIEVYL